MNLRKITLVALFAAIISVLSQIAIPLPSGVPATLQTFAIALCAYVLGSVYAPMSVFIYVLLGVAGLPVFASFKSGIGTLFGVTGGFIFGFIIMSFILARAYKMKKINCILVSVVGVMICHICGIAQFMILTESSFPKALMLVSLPYVVKDFVSVVFAYPAAIKINTAISKMN